MVKKTPLWLSTLSAASVGAAISAVAIIVSSKVFDSIPFFLLIMFSSFFYGIVGANIGQMIRNRSIF